LEQALVMAAALTKLLQRKLACADIQLWQLLQGLQLDGALQRSLCCLVVPGSLLCCSVLLRLGQHTLLPHLVCQLTMAPRCILLPCLLIELSSSNKMALLRSNEGSGACCGSVGKATLEECSVHMATTLGKFSSSAVVAVVNKRARSCSTRRQAQRLQLASVEVGRRRCVGVRGMRSVHSVRSAKVGRRCWPCSSNMRSVRSVQGVPNIESGQRR
jgi:hypothetical protein